MERKISKGIEGVFKGVITVHHEISPGTNGGRARGNERLRTLMGSAG